MSYIQFLPMQDNQQNLEIVADNEKFNDWMYSEIKPFIKGDILEVGSGLGTFSRRIIQDFLDKAEKIMLSDIDPRYLKNLESTFQNQKVKVRKIDLAKAEDFTQLIETGQKFETIICLNVLEHVKDDVLALDNLHKVLRPNGQIILLVPAHKFLFNSLDEAVLHFRRYTKEELFSKVGQTKLQISNIFHFNIIAILGWFINGTIFKKRVLSVPAFSFFNKLVPFFRFVERKILFRFTGLSIIAILKNRA